MIFVIGTLGLICVMLAWMLHNAWSELEDLYDENEELREEADELARIASNEKQKARHYEMIFQESEFEKFKGRVKGAAS